jgi:RNA polymerase sigma-70 factor (ECF subfamily)
MVAASPSARPGVSDAKKRWLSDPQVQLMLRVQRGDGEAFAQLVRELRPRVYGYFVRLVRHRAEAEDLTQEVFLRLFRSRERYKPRARLSTWVFHITQNVARNALRSRRRRPAIPVDFTQLGQSEDLFLCSTEAPPSEPLERAELAGVVRDAVEGLGDRQRQAVCLHQLEGWTYNEVAEELEMSPKAAKSLLYRARNQLRAALTPLVV